MYSYLSLYPDVLSLARRRDCRESRSCIQDSSIVSDHTNTYNNLTESDMKFSIAATALLCVLVNGANETKSVKTCRSNGPGMVSTSHATATEIGYDILQAGGNAVDAMIAVQAVLGLVEPQSSGFGGGAFALLYSNESSSVTSYDGRETAPAAAMPDRFAAFPAGLFGFVGAWQSGLSVGVPGVPKLLHTMYDAHASLPLQTLLQPALDLAANGFPLAVRTYDTIARMHSLVNQGSCVNRTFFRDPAAFEYFFDSNCTIKEPGTTLTNPAYADMLQIMIDNGSDPFYSGDIATDIVAAVQGDLATPGDMTLDDLADYNVVERPPVCADYKGDSVCGMGPPSSGGLAVGQMMGLLENKQDDFIKETNTSTFPLPLHPQNVHLFTQANRLAFADRNQYVADPDFVDVPSEGMLDTNYLADRATLIDATKDMGLATPGVPPEASQSQGPDSRVKGTGTSHVSIVDSSGNAVSLTSSIEAPFGNGVMVRGYFLNNELTDFSFAAEAEGTPIANRVQGGKRPRSSMSPTIVLANGKPKMVLGSPGGGSIPAYTAQTLWNALEFGLGPQESMNIPHVMNNNDNTKIEAPADGLASYDAEALKDKLETPFGHEDVSIADMDSGLTMIEIDELHWMGGTDPRRDGAVGPSVGNECDNGAPTLSPIMLAETKSPTASGSGNKSTGAPTLSSIMLVETSSPTVSGSGNKRLSSLTMTSLVAAVLHVLQ